MLTGVGPRRLAHNPLLPVRPALPQPIQLRYRQPGQTLEARIAKVVVLPIQNPLRGRPTERFMRFVHFGQQGDVGIGITAGELMAPVNPSLHYAAFPVLRNQARHLRPAQSRHLRHIAPDHAFTHPAQASILLLDQRPPHPCVHPAPVRRLKMQLVARLEKRPNLLQTQPLAIHHADVQYPACANPSGSSCVRNRFPLQAHLA
jgi:hypothetical protein